VIGWIGSAAGTRATFGAVGGLALVLAGWAATMPRPAGHRPQPLAALARAVRTPRLAVAIWFVVLPALLFGTLTVLAPLRLHALGGGSLLIGAAFLVAAACEAVVNPLLGRLSDRRGRLLPIRGGLIAAAIVTVLLPWPHHRFLLAALVVLAGISFGSFWTPAMSNLADAAEEEGLEHGYTFALINLAWAPGQALGASGSGALASLASDAAPYLLLGGLCLFTFAALWRSSASS
jgi:predicted MFS family arabinose efflux permease